MKTLVVYYSLSGNTKFAAETIAAELGADIVEIVDLKKRQGKLAFLSNGRDAGQGKETEIAPIQKSATDYDTIIVGTPIWNKNPTPAIRTYLNSNNLAGKKVGLFFSDSSFGLTQAIEKTKMLVPNAVIVGDFALAGKDFGNKEAAKTKIVAWSQTLKEAKV